MICLTIWGLCAATLLTEVVVNWSILISNTSVLMICSSTSLIGFTHFWESILMLTSPPFHRVLLCYSTSHLRCLRLACCDDISDEGLCEVAGKLPLLEELDISIGNISKRSLEVIGRNCPRIKSLKFNMEGFRRPHIESDDEAFAVAKTMPELRHLQLFGNKLTNVGLHAILDGCPHLESLDLRQCFNINLEGTLGKRCAEQIKDLRRPNDPTNDYPFDATVRDVGSLDEDYPLGISDTDFLSDDDYEFDYYAFSDGSDFSDNVGYYFDPDTY
ncbi:putative F-box/LRR-repeat protein 23 isoform X2 [Prosopis cineraria]|uniref:putative F-box/LRR-repeat protein 23 isoform X2 n=1 Tax=Prosopis cineraria TaxID=364024 RepID=UPI00240F9B6C|nr:putative F-box/LRR-repeat protein 23 isoform X2 [Prosopis cineraria]